MLEPIVDTYPQRRTGVALHLRRARLTALLGVVIADRDVERILRSLGLIVTPSLAHISGAAEAAGLESYGVVYGLYNVAWSIGVMFGPAIGGWIYDRAGFRTLTFVWAPFIIVTALALRARAVRQEVSFRAIEHRAT